jgi:hypothetical protein
MNSALSRQRRQHRLAGIRAQEQELRKRPAKPTADKQTAPTIRDPDRLPDPWLFDSEKLLRELDRCREMVLLIPAPTHETHFAINIAVNAIWDLRDNLRYCFLSIETCNETLPRKAKPSPATIQTLDATPPNPPLRAVGETSTEGKRKRVSSSSGRSRP